ncbi:MAG: hypothetical protein Q9180_000700 [Flavoplaca navasiana]
MTSVQAHKDAKGAKLVAGFYSHLVTLCSALAESRLFDRVKHPRLVRGFESGVNDCGLIVGPDDVPGGTPTDRSFALRQDHNGNTVVVPMEIKYASIAHDESGNAVYHFGLTEDQWDTVQAIILRNFQEPDYVAVIPIHYIRQRLKGEYCSGGIFDHLRPLWTLHPLPSFAHELAPFITPIARLYETLNSMYQYANGSGKAWINKHTGVPFKVPALTRWEPSILEPSQPSKQTAQAMIEQIHSAFQGFSNIFRVEFNDNFPFLGDFKIVDLDRAELFVEAKLQNCQFQLEKGDPSNYMRHRQILSLHGGIRLIFSWKAQWDFLYTASGNEALFLPRDLIPTAFWLDRTSEWLEWPADKLDSLREYMIDRSSPIDMVASIERIIQKAKSPSGSAKARDPIAVVPYHEEPMEELMFDPGSQNAEAPEDFWTVDGNIPRGRWNSKGYRRGFGSPLHSVLRGNTYEYWAMEAITEIFRRTGRGLIRDLGRRNTMCRMYMTKYNWNRKDRSRYDSYGEQPQDGGLRLHRRTHLVRVSFLRLRWGYDYNPSATQSVPYMLGRLVSRKPSLLICDMTHYQSIRLPHARYIIPSNQFPKGLGHNAIVRLKNGTWDGHRVDDDQIVDVITSVLNGDNQVRIGESLVDCRDYTCFHEDAMKHGVTEWAKTVDADEE